MPDTTTEDAEAMTERMTRLGDRAALPIRVADDLRERLAKQEWTAGDQLPTEAELVTDYSVSRATVRQALKTLENQGLIITRRGRGSFVSGDSMIRAGMQELTSITSTIRDMGHEPKMIYHHRILRPASSEERDAFDLEPGSEILDIQRKILADDLVVCYSYDYLPRWVFPEEFTPDRLTGSVFAYIREHEGPIPLRALARVHAVAHPDVIWDEDYDDDQLFVLLDQMHYDERARPFMHTVSYFVEGRFNFTVVRTAPSGRFRNS